MALNATFPEISSGSLSQGRVASTNTTRRNILGVHCDFLGYEDVLETIQSWREKGERHYITVVNPHSVLLCRRDSGMRQAVARAALTLPDGIGVVVAARILGHHQAGRVTGPALMLNLCDWGRRYGFRHYFYGGAKGVADELIQRLSNQFPGMEVAGSYCPPFRELTPEEDQGAIERINAAKPDIVWIGLGAPKQEKWIADHSGQVDGAVMIGVGAAFDFHSGRIQWAPQWVRRCGLEWAWRLVREPRRLWKRNLDSPIFLMGALWQKITRFGTRKDGMETDTLHPHPVDRHGALKTAFAGDGRRGPEEREQIGS
ncbi:WecB/TagA/CpsF family glycosyltransferase [bacterium]|nr:WecB/TagA/CpsF family glycosyltransferase [bacterium]